MKLLSFLNKTVRELITSSDAKSAIYSMIASFFKRNYVAYLDFHVSGSAFVLLNQDNAEQYLGNADSNQRQFDSSPFNYVRLSGTVAVVSASPNNPRLFPQYSIDNGANWITVGSGTGTDAISFASLGVFTTVWIPLPTAAKADIRWRVGQNGGNTVADPGITNLSINFKS